MGGEQRKGWGRGSCCHIEVEWRNGSCQKRVVLSAKMAKPESLEILTLRCCQAAPRKRQRRRKALRDVDLKKGNALMERKKERSTDPAYAQEEYHDFNI